MAYGVCATARQADSHSLCRHCSIIFVCFAHILSVGFGCHMVRVVNDRTEAVLRRLQQRAPVMSDAERDALSELKDVQKLLCSYSSKMKMV